MKEVARQPVAEFAQRHDELHVRLAALADEYDALNIAELEVGKPWITEAISAVLRAMSVAMELGRAGEVVPWANAPRKFLAAHPDTRRHDIWLVTRSEGLRLLVDLLEGALASTTSLTQPTHAAHAGLSPAERLTSRAEAAVGMVFTQLVTFPERYISLRQELPEPLPVTNKDHARPTHRARVMRGVEGVRDLLSHFEGEPRELALKIVRAVLEACGHPDIDGVLSALYKETARKRKRKAPAKSTP